MRRTPLPPITLRLLRLPAAPPSDPPLRRHRRHPPTPPPPLSPGRSNAYFGISSATGDLVDNHDIVQFTVGSLEGVADPVQHHQAWTDAQDAQERAILEEFDLRPAEATQRDYSRVLRAQGAPPRRRAAPPRRAARPAVPHARRLLTRAPAPLLGQPPRSSRSAAIWTS